jgi:hypothetical protein
MTGNFRYAERIIPTASEVLHDNRDFEIRSLALKMAAGCGLDYKTTLMIAREYEAFLRGITSHPGN